MCVRCVALGALFKKTKIPKKYYIHTRALGLVRAPDKEPTVNVFCIFGSVAVIIVDVHVIWGAEGSFSLCRSFDFIHPLK